MNFLGFYMNYHKYAKSLTFRRGSEVGHVKVFDCWGLWSYLPFREFGAEQELRKDRSFVLEFRA